MIFEFNPFEFDVAEHRALTILIEYFLHFYGDRHTCFFADENYLESTWFQNSLHDIQKEDLKKVFTYSASIPKARSRPNYFRISSHTDFGKSTLSISDSEKLLKKPIQIVVENAVSDNAFINAIIACFGNKALKIAWEQKWVVTEQAGGVNEIPKMVRKIEANIGSWISQRTVLIVFDSDRINGSERWEERNDRKDHLSLKNEGYFVHCWYKRTIENYLPIETLSKIAKPEELIQVFASLPNDAQDFYSLEHGFHNKGKVPEGQEQLFKGGLSDPKSQEFKLLRKGFENAKKLHLGFGDHETVTRNSLSARCSHHPAEFKEELSILINAIKERV